MIEFLFILVGVLFLAVFYAVKTGSKKSASLLSGIQGLSKNFSKVFASGQLLKSKSSGLKQNAVKMKELSQSLEYSADENSLTVAESSQNLQQMEDRIAYLEEQFSGSLASLARFEVTIDEITSKHSEVKEMMNMLNLIGEQMEVIGSITFQTKILSFNAAIEAQRADAVSRHGFNVVAKEIKKLADHTEKTAKGIEASFDEAKGFFQNYQKESSEGFERLVKGVAETRAGIKSAERELAGLSVCKSKVMSLNTKVLDASGMLKEISSKSASLAITNESNSESVELQLKSLQQSVEDMNADIASLAGKLTGTKVVDIGPHEAAGKLGEFAVLIDVRGKSEYNDELGHLSNSILLTIDESFTSGLSNFSEKAAMPVLFICRSGGRSARAARLAQQHGFKKAYNLEGGMLAWNKEGLPTEVDFQGELNKTA